MLPISILDWTAAGLYPAARHDGQRAEKPHFSAGRTTRIWAYIFPAITPHFPVCENHFWLSMPDHGAVPRRLSFSLMLPYLMPRRAAINFQIPGCWSTCTFSLMMTSKIAFWFFAMWM